MKIFIGGSSIYSAKKLKLPYKKIYDYVKEGSSKDHKKNHELNVLALTETKNSTHAIKLTSIYNNNLKNYLHDYHEQSIKNNNKILIDAEDVKNQEMINDYTNHCIETYNSGVFYKTYQMYRNDSFILLENDLLKYKKFGIKLVRGAYHNQDKNTGIIYLNKTDTDNDYNNAIRLLSTHKNDVLVATHNKESCEIAMNFQKKFKYAQLLGMNDTLSNYLLEKNNDVYKYVPYGKWHESIPYLTRRLYENYSIMRYIF